MGMRTSASITHSLGTMLTFSPARTTPMLTVIFCTISDAPGPRARSVVSVARASSGPTLPGGGVSISSRRSRSAMRRAPILLALSEAWVYAPCAPRVFTLNSIHSGPFSPKRMLYGLLGSPFRQQSPCTSGWCSTR